MSCHRRLNRNEIYILAKVLSIFILFLISKHSLSQQILGKSYTVEDGLCKNTIRDIIQDGDGFIWLATDEGIDRFDGSEFKHYDLEKGDFPLGLKNHVQKLYISNDSILWAGTRRGPMRYDRLKDEFYMPGSIMNSSISEWNIYSFQSGVNNELWIGGYHGYTILDGDSLKSKYTNSDILAVWSLCMNSDGFMWIGYKDGLKRINPHTGEQKDYFPILPRNYPDESLIIRDIVKLDHGDLLLMTVPEGIYQYNLMSDSFEKTGIFQEKRERIITTSIECDPAGKYLFGIDGIGLVLTDTNYTILPEYVSPEKDPAIVDRIYVDTDGAYWFASRGNGIQYHNPNRVSFQTLNVQSGDLSVQRGNDIFSIVQDRKGSLWAGTNMGISIWNENFLQYNKLFITDISPKIKNNRVRVLCEDKNGSFWIGTYSEGLIHYNPESGKSTIYQENRRKSIGSNFIATIYQDSEEAIWVGSIRSNISRLNPETGDIKRYPLNNIRCLTESKNNEILAGSFDGLFVLNPETGSFKHYHSNVDSEYRLSNSRISCISVDSVGIIYLGTHGGGVNIIDRKHHTIEYLTSEDGLPSNHISGIVIDQYSDFWISTSNGLTSWNKKEGTLKIYNASDGLFTSEFNTGAYWKSKDGTLFFGGRGGISIIEPDIIYEKEITHTIYFDEFFVNNKKIIPASSDSPLTKHINETEIIKLRHDENSFVFKFTGLDFDTQKKNRYKWILEGFDNVWSRPVDIREAGYANIPSGKYTFKVGFSENGLTWNKVRTIQVIILPPWWATQLAKIIYLILGLAFFMFIAYFLYLRIKKKNAEEKIRFFANIAHEIASPLSLISGPLNDLEVHADSHLENREENLRVIQKNLRRIHNLVKQLLEFQKLDLKTNSVIGSTLKFPDSIEEVLFEFQPRCKKKNLEISLESQPAKFTFKTDKDMLTKILGNLISNAIKYTGDGGEIKITCVSQKELLRLEVKDNGIGIPKDQQRNLFRRYFRADNAVLSREAGTGIGMMLVYSLTKMLDGKIRFSSKENIGTTFRIEIPQLKHKDQLKDTEVPVESDRGADPGSYLKGKDGLDKHVKTKLFIIEDNNDLRNYLQKYFKNKYRVRTFENGDLALEYLKNEHPDIIITDIMMEGINGLELCQKIKGNIELCHIPIILITALISDDSEIDGMQFGADAYVKKPFDIKVLEARVENLLHGRKVLRDKFIGADVDINKIEFQAELDKAFMEKVAAIVGGHLEESDFSVISLSRELGMSRSALYVKIKELTGKSPQEFIKLIKLQKAKKLLLLGQMTVMEVAFETGFNDAKYFSTTFKKHFGMSPSEVRSK